MNVNKQSQSWAQYPLVNPGSGFVIFRGSCGRNVGRFTAYPDYSTFSQGQGRFFVEILHGQFRQLNYNRSHTILLRKKVP